METVKVLKEHHITGGLRKPGDKVTLDPITAQALAGQGIVERTGVTAPAETKKSRQSFGRGRERK